MSKDNIKINSCCSWSDIMTDLLALPPFFRLRSYTLLGKTVHWEIEHTSSSGLCPHCSVASSRVHSYYSRTLSDLKASSYSCVLQVRCRKYYCRNPACLCRIFCNPIPELSCRYGRFTNRALLLVQEISLCTSSRTASRLLSLSGLGLGARSCIRHLLSLPLPGMKNIRHVGIDDFATLKGQTYGSVVVDQLTGLPVEVLGSRDEEDVTRFLKRNPHILTVTRDRASCFSNAVDKALPHAEQVCDRFHLLKNLSDAVIKDTCTRIKQHEKDIRDERLELPAKETILSRLKEDLFELGDQRKLKELRTYLQVHELMCKGMNTAEIAQQTGIKPKYIYKYSRMKKMDHLLTPEQKCLLKHLDQIASLMSQGVFDLKELAGSLPEIKSEWIARLTIKLRKEWKGRKKLVRDTKKEIRTGKVKVPHKEIFKAFFQPGYNTKNTALLRIFQQDQKMKRVAKACMYFREMMNTCKPSMPLEKWMQMAMESGSVLLQKFAKGIKAEEKAVRNAIEYQWSNGIVEGTVNKIKAIKRQMYGRAGIELLRRKVVLARYG